MKRKQGAHRAIVPLFAGGLTCDWTGNNRAENRLPARPVHLVRRSAAPYAAYQRWHMHPSFSPEMNVQHTLKRRLAEARKRYLRDTALTVLAVLALAFAPLLLIPFLGASVLAVSWILLLLVLLSVLILVPLAALAVAQARTLEGILLEAPGDVSHLVPAATNLRISGIPVLSMTGVRAFTRSGRHLYVRIPAATLSEVLACMQRLAPNAVIGPRPVS